MNELFFNQVVTYIRKLDPSILIDLVYYDKEENKIKGLSGFQWDNVELARFGYDKVKIFKLEYIPVMKRYVCYIELVGVPA